MVFELLWVCFGIVFGLCSVCLGLVLDLFWTCFGFVSVLDLFGICLAPLASALEPIFGENKNVKKTMVLLRETHHVKIAASFRRGFARCFLRSKIDEKTPMSKPNQMKSNHSKANPTKKQFPKPNTNANKSAQKQSQKTKTDPSKPSL